MFLDYKSILHFLKFFEVFSRKVMTSKRKLNESRDQLRPLIFLKILRLLKDLLIHLVAIDRGITVLGE